LCFGKGLGQLGNLNQLRWSERKLPRLGWLDNLEWDANVNWSFAEKLLGLARTMARLRPGGILDLLFARRFLWPVSHANLHALHPSARLAGIARLRWVGLLERRWTPLARRFDWFGRRIAGGHDL